MDEPIPQGSDTVLHTDVTLRRAGALIQAAFFILAVSLAPAVHGKLCDDICALQHQASHAPCHSHEKGTKGDCQCLGDCCSMHACCVTPDAPHDLAPPSVLAVIVRPAPEKAPRAPDAWRLPYPTGPPATA